MEARRFCKVHIVGAVQFVARYTEVAENYLETYRK